MRYCEMHVDFHAEFCKDTLRNEDVVSRLTNVCVRYLDLHDHLVDRQIYYIDMEI